MIKNEEMKIKKCDFEALVRRTEYYRIFIESIIDGLEEDAPKSSKMLRDRFSMINAALEE